MSPLSEAMRNFERAVLERDRDLAEQVLHEEYALVRVQPTPGSMPRAQWLDLLPDYVVHSWTVQERVVDESGDVAAVLSRVDMDATVLGEPRTGLFLVSDFWRRGEDGWRVWRRHSSPLTAGELPGG